MLGLQGSASSSKVYRCVACSATFNGLASLLVHQATHASTLSKVPAPLPTQPDISPHETLFTSKDSSSEHHSSLLSEGSSPSFYICDCGEEFKDFSRMLEHKHSHAPQIQLLDPPVNTILTGGTGPSNTCPNPSPHAQFDPAVTQSGLVLSCSSTSRTPAAHKDHQKDENLKDGDVAMVTAPQGQCTSPQDGEKPLGITSAPTEETQDFQDEPVLSGENCESLPKNNALMKLLASAYMKHFPSAQSENDNDDSVTPKKEADPVDITPPESVKADVSPINDLSIVQLRRLLAKPGFKTKSPSISRILECSRMKIVSLTKTFSPVVVLETRQKLMDPSNNGIYGRYQCGRCRRIFQSMDRLTEHHFLHKKERVKCCRRCKQLIIGRLPFPDNHVCPQNGKKAIHLSSKLPLTQKVVPFHSISNTKKVFFCPLCKHSYARRYNLKMHKCPGRPSGFQHPNSSPERMQALRSNSKARSDAEMTDGPQTPKSVSIGTEVTGRIKVEVTSPSSEQTAVSRLRWSHPAKSLSPFLVKSSVMEQLKGTSQGGTSLKQREVNSWDAEASNDENSSEGQWTMPLDDEMELLSSAKNAAFESATASTSDKMAPITLRYFVKDGVKRYPCTRCQKTYSRPSTLARHLRLCGFTPREPETVEPNNSQRVITVNANNTRPMFPCFVCGKSFNRKDNMMVHRKKCQLRRTVSDADMKTLQQNNSSNATDCPTKEDDGSNWGIMSLPSVLPRRVTCECGVGFTSPRLLLEHLQKHAQESYTCPTCGETVNSWADYEVHLQIHMHPHHQLLKGLQPQRSHPLLLRFQQQPVHPTSQQQPVLKPPQKQPPTVQLTHLSKKQQRMVCNRCGNTFATRCSLRRHLSWNRCKGGRVSNPPANPPKTYHCSHCNTNFPNSISLIFHQRSGACKPAIKPVRCPVCLRWFGTVDGLQKHLLSHKQSAESYSCDVCRGTYPNLKSLKNHRRRIHRIMAGDAMPQPQEMLTS